MTSPEILHASCVCLQDRGVLITGASASGKSALALALMAYGATLVADDKVCVTAKDGQLIAYAPAAITGLIEARGVGILTAQTAVQSPLVAVVDLDQVEEQRLPQTHEITISGIPLPLFYDARAPHFAAALLQFMKSGRHAT